MVRISIEILLSLNKVLCKWKNIFGFRVSLSLGELGGNPPVKSISQLSVN